MQIDKKIEYWKNRLLDLGKRNRLINSYYPKSSSRISRTALLIYNPSLQSIWSTIVEKESKIIFPIPEDFDIDLEEQNENNESELHDGIRTNQSHRETYKTLRSLSNKAKVFREEKGFNALYLAFGFLNWKENGLEGIEMKSPLLLVPVNLTQESINDPITISRTDDEITINHALEQKLLNDFGIKIPKFEESEDCLTYILEVENMCKSLKWTVDKKYTQLTLYSFLKINMYRDIDKYYNLIANHPIIQSINGESYSISKEYLDINDYNHDATDPKEVFSVLDADSSQQDAVLLAKRGVSFVLQGPPGTGKSQTITNIIAELIADGKKVLFVSEKKAALEVVYKRLKQVNLHNYCLSLHSHNSKRREILDQLEVSSKLAKSKAKIHEDAYMKMINLKSIRSYLNEYNIQLHTIILPIGLSIYQINGLLSRFSKYKNVDYIQSNADTLSQEQFSNIEVALEELTRIVDKSGYQQDNPWKGCSILNVTHEFRQQFLVDSVLLIDKINAGIIIHDEFKNLTSDETHISSWLSNMELVKSINILNATPNINYNWLNLDIDDLIKKVLICKTSTEAINFKQEFFDELVLTLENINFNIEIIFKTIKSDVYRGVDVNNHDYILLCERFRELLPEENIHSKISGYNELASNIQDLLDNLVGLELKQNKLNRELSESNDLFKAETDLHNQKNEIWTNARNIFLTDFDEDILSLDFDSMLSRYRVDYRSNLKRLFNKAYNTDKKSIIMYYKQSKKISYHDSLTFIEKAKEVMVYENDVNLQFEILNKVREDRDVIISNVDGAVAEIKMVKSEISESLHKLNEIKDKLVHEVSECSNSHEAWLNNESKKLARYSKIVSNKLKIDIKTSTDFDSLIELLDKTIILQTEIKKHSFSDETITKISQKDPQMFASLQNIANSLNMWIDSTKPLIFKFFDLFEQNRADSFMQMDLPSLLANIEECSEKFSCLEYLIDYQHSVELLRSLGIDEYLELAKNLHLSSKEIIPVFKKCFYRSWLDMVMPKYSAVNMFRREKHDSRIKEFKELDKSHLAISTAALQARLLSRLPNLDSSLVNFGEVALLRREMAKQRKLLPIRRLIGALPNLLPTLKPCMMMSPLSVSTYFGDSDYQFDTVLFDEASQIRTEDAVCSIFRAKQVIIAGDSKQLPPTDFFASSITDSEELSDENGDFNDNGAYESLLDESAMLPSRTLIWHYRSKHEHLIAFSNSQIYNNNLITFPSSIDKDSDIGVEYHYVKGGTYERQGRKANVSEAEQIVELVFDHFAKKSDRSIGIIAFGEAQQNAIEELIMKKRRANPQYEEFFKDDKDEPLFIKNLETVQGDERDTIIFSIGYAPDSRGKFLMNFGPLSKSGGERRLNVAITRARFNLKLVGSILPTDIDLSRISGLGPKLLRLYIDFALNGESVLQRQISISDNIQFDSPFEESVYDFLTQNNYDVQTQVGCSGYRIDLAIKHPKYNGRYAIGIECDGASYHSARTARERDRLRQTVLEDMGWKIYRIWSTDWIKDPYTEGQRLLKAIEMAINEYHEFGRPATSAVNKSFITLSRKSDYESTQEKYRLIESQYSGYKAEDIPLYDFENTIMRVLQFNYGLSKIDLFKETALYGYQWARQGKNIKEKFEKAFSNLVVEHKIFETSGKVKICEDAKSISLSGQ